LPVSPRTLRSNAFPEGAHAPQPAVDLRVPHLAGAGALALISKFGAIGINVPRYLPHQEYWLAIVAYMVLMVGNLVRGL